MSISGGTLYTSAKRPGGQILGGTLCTTTPARHGSIVVDGDMIAIEP